MNTSKGAQLVDRFIQALNDLKGIKVVRTSISRNVFEFKSRSNSLLYVKGRAEKPFRWGVTANVVERLQAQPKPWVVILLFESHERGYLLNSKDVEHYIRAIWPLAKDGDYKPATGSYLSRNSPLFSVMDFVDSIEMIKTV